MPAENEDREVSATLQPMPGKTIEDLETALKPSGAELERPCVGILLFTGPESALDDVASLAYVTINVDHRFLPEFND